MEIATLSRHESRYIMKEIRTYDRDDSDDMLFNPEADEATARQGYEDFMNAWIAQQEQPVSP